MNGLLGYSERYPEIQATQNFSDLQAQLEGTENRIAVARKRFNEAVQGYNGKVRRFPGVFWAGMFGFWSESILNLWKSQKRPHL